MNLNELKVTEHVQLDNVLPMLGGINNIGASGYSGKGEVRAHEALKNIKNNPALYFKSLHFLKSMLGEGVDFNHRESKFHKKALSQYAAMAPKPGVGYFAENTGIPAGGQLKALVDLPLTDVSLGYFNEDYFANRFLTSSPVGKQTGLIGRYGNEHNREYNKRELLADGRANVRQLYPYSNEFLNYFVATYALMDSLSPNDIANFMLPFNAEQDLVIAIKQILMLACEIDLVTQLYQTAGYPASSVITLTNNDDKFSKKDSDLDGQIRKLRASILSACGKAPNTMVCDENVFDALSRHDDVRGTIFQDVTTSRTASEAEVAKLFKVDRLFVAKTAKTTSSSSTAEYQRVWGKNIWFGFINPNKSLRQQTFGFFHHWRNSDSYVITRQSIGNPVNKDVFCYQSWQHHITDRRCGGLIVGAIE